MARLALYLLGPPRIQRDGQPVEVRRRKAVALLAYLAVTAQGHSRDALATLFWPEHDQSRARAGLRRTLASLKKGLGEGWLEVDRENVGLNSNTELWLDVEAFQDRLAACGTHGHPAQEMCPDCLPLLAEAVELYCDDFLAGFTLRDSPAFDEWQFFQSESLRGGMASALERLMHGHRERGEYQPAIAYARRWLALDPLHEPAHRCLMRLYARSDQRAAALRQYAECERILQEELGVSPEDETTQLYQAIKDHREGTPAESQPERYRLERKLSGKGSFGDLWLATDTLLDRPVAIKCPKAADDPIRRERFLVEARMLARLNHPNITQIYDAFFDEGEGNLYLVMEYVDGRDLSDIIKAGTSLPLDIILEVTVGILRALSYAHQQGVVHRDVKPANVMIAEDVKLMDFGLANLRSILGRGAGFMAGTPAYMAPEQIEGRAVDGRADLYALGVILFEMLSGGRLPFEHTDQVEMLDAHLHTPPPPINQLAPTVPPVLEGVVARLLAKDPEERYPSAEVVIEVLESIHVGPKLTNLPVSLTPFVGREAELAEIQEHLGDPDCRLLTLVGPGGCGKTRLAVEAATAQIDSYAHGVFFVSLAPLDSIDSIVPTVAEALGFRFYEGIEPKQQLLDHLRQKKMLLIMDNFEHLLACPEPGRRDGASLVTDILQMAPDVKILATSRARLNVRGEHRFHIAGMDYPTLERQAAFTPSPSYEDRRWELKDAAQSARYAALRQHPEQSVGQDVTQYGAVKLFLQVARQSQTGFELTCENLVGVIGVCRVVEGMPLAIQLAVAWMEMLTPSEIVTEISQGLDFLETNLRDMPERQRSMRVVFDHSWKLLTEREKEVFRALSVFRGGFTRQAARQVSGASLRDLMALVNKSLLHCPPTGRYEIHELLRQYAAEKLAERIPEKADIQQKHSAYYVEFLRQQQVTLSAGDRPDRAVQDTIDIEIENIRVAWQWLLAQGELETIVVVVDCLWLFYKRKALYQEAVSVFRQACSLKAASAQQKGHWQRLLAEAHCGLGQPVESRGHLRRALVHLGQPMPTTTGAMAIGLLGQVLRQIWRWVWPACLRLSLPLERKSPEASASLLEAARSYNRLAQMYYTANEAVPMVYTVLRELNLAERASVSPELARAYANMGAGYRFFHFHSLAQVYFHRAQEIAQKLEDPSALARVSMITGMWDFGFRPWAEIRKNTEQAIALYKRLEDKRGWGDSLTHLGFILYWGGQFAQGVDVGVELQTLGAESNNLEHQAWGLNLQAMNLLRLGKTDQAVARLETAQSLLPLITQSRVAEAINYGVVAIARLRQGHRQAAQQAGETAAHVIGQSLPTSFALLDGYVGSAEMYLALWEDAIFSGEEVEANPLKSAAKNACQAIRKFSWWQPIGRPRAWLSWGLYYWLAGKPRKAHQAWQRSLTHAQRLEMPYEEGLAHYEIGRHLPLDDPHRSERLMQACDIFDKLGAIYDLERAQGALQS
jgi:predicted ATPase/DNA-binding SARP family transcriptional activator